LFAFPSDGAFRESAEFVLEAGKPDCLFTAFDLRDLTFEFGYAQLLFCAFEAGLDTLPLNDGEQRSSAKERDRDLSDCDPNH